MSNRTILFICAGSCILAGAIISLATAAVVGTASASHLAGGSIACGMSVWQIYYRLTVQKIERKSLKKEIGIALLHTLIFCACGLFGWEITLYLYHFGVMR